MKPRVWLVSGSREFPDERLARAIFRAQFREGDTVIHGGARGIDTWAGEEAAKLGATCQVWPADWDNHGKNAGVIRNRHMLDEAHYLRGRAMIFWDGRSKGTKHMLDLVQAVNFSYVLIEVSL